MLIQLVLNANWQVDGGLTVSGDSEADMLADYVEGWRTSISLAKEALQHRQAALDRVGELPNDSGTLSLVMVLNGDGESVIQYVNWRWPSSWTGQEVAVRNKEVVYSMLVGEHAKPWTCYKTRAGGCTILHPDSGVRMRRHGKGMRPFMNDEVLRLARMVTASLRVDEVPVGACEVCRAPEEEGLRTCCICLKAFHVGCCGAFPSALVRSTVHSVGRWDWLSSWPGQMQECCAANKLCPFCAEHVRR